jgi:hypothetical protein
LALIVCGVVDTALTQINAAIALGCATSDTDTFNSVISFFLGPQPVFVNVDLDSLNYVHDVQVAPSPDSGDYPKVNVALDCPMVDHVTVDPAAASTSVGQTIALSAAAYYSGDNGLIKSSALNFEWEPDPDGVTSVDPLIQTWMSVADVEGNTAGGPVNVTATETVSTKFGTSQVMVGTSYAGTAPSASANFGGAPYCNYTATLTNIQMSLNFDLTEGTILAGQISDVMTETNTDCPYGTIAPNVNAYAISSATLSNNNISATFTPSASNEPLGTATFQGTLSGATITGTLTFQRPDTTAPILAWTVVAQAQLTQQK